MSTVKIDTLLYETKILKIVLMDNYAIKQNEFRPLDEFHEVMKQHAREYAKALVTQQLSMSLSEETLELHEKEFYEDLEYEIFEALKEEELEKIVTMTDEEIDKENLPAYKEQCQKYMWLKLYLKKMQGQGITEFRLVINSNRTGLIHPLGKDGETLDFNL